MVTPPPAAVFSRLKEMLAASSDGQISRLAASLSFERGNSEVRRSPMISGVKPG